jgi:predicted MarR family transcription regulator
VLGGSPTLPERGDLIRETQGAKTFIYEVMAPGKEPPWRWSDVFRKVLRIHTKQVGTE